MAALRAAVDDPHAGEHLDRRLTQELGPSLEGADSPLAEVTDPQVFHRRRSLKKILSETAAGELGQYTGQTALQRRVGVTNIVRKRHREPAGRRIYDLNTELVEDRLFESTL